jgi:hypothetical protein
VISAAIWFVIKAVHEVYNYSQFKVRVEAEIDRWEVHELSSDQFVVMAQYSYIYQEKKYNGEDRTGQVYPNPWAANVAKSRFLKQKWSVWLNPKKPEKSMIEKHFPIKSTISTIVLLCLILYFLWLKNKF